MLTATPPVARVFLFLAAQFTLYHGIAAVTYIAGGTLMESWNKEDVLTHKTAISVRGPLLNLCVSQYEVCSRNSPEISAVGTRTSCDTYSSVGYRYLSKSETLNCCSSTGKV